MLRLLVPLIRNNFGDRIENAPILADTAVYLIIGACFLHFLLAHFFFPSFLHIEYNITFPICQHKNYYDFITKSRAGPKLVCTNFFDGGEGIASSQALHKNFGFDFYILQTCMRVLEIIFTREESPQNFCGHARTRDGMVGHVIIGKAKVNVFVGIGDYLLRHPHRVHNGDAIGEKITLARFCLIANGRI